jgi:tetratricopeptide (TPR) repeat protein
MIVKNEAHLIIECFEHLRKFITFDYWVINDNGSTDGTQDLIRNYFAEKGIPGELDETPWQDFAYNRTIVFQRAYQKTDYAFVWDADDEIAGDFVFPTHLTKSHYRFIFGHGGGLRYSRAQLFNNHMKWCYVGVVHETPSCLEPCGPPTDVLGNYYFISGRRGARNKNPQKYLHDAQILEKAFEKAYAEKDSIYQRYAFYTGQSYNCCNMYEKSIEFYKKVLTFDNSSEEKYISCIQIFEQYEHLKREDEGIYYLVESFRYNKRRLEGIYRLIKYYSGRGMHEVSYAYYSLIQNYYENAYQQDHVANNLFVKKEEYDFYLPYYMIIVSERLKKMDTFIKMYQMIFTQDYRHASEWWIHNLFYNLQFGIAHLPPDLGFLSSMLTYLTHLQLHNMYLTPDLYRIVDRVIAHYRPLLTAPCERSISRSEAASPLRVMFTMTTCKRFDLFQQTVNSIKRNWKDLDQIDYFLCVDDNSSEEDRMKMQTDYPFFNYYMKTPEEKGHRQSMNIIWNKLKELQPTYWIHLEDDWVYFQSDNYVTKGIEMLEKYEDRNIHQLVFNREYGLMMEDMKRISGSLLEPGFWLHDQKPVSGPSCAYWPHYSLQPSITRTKIILELGNYDTDHAFFERGYSNKYGAAGYQTMFINSICSLHIGKQHWEKEGKNAYELNEIVQGTN